MGTCFEAYPLGASYFFSGMATQAAAAGICLGTAFALTVSWWMSSTQLQLSATTHPTVTRIPVPLAPSSVASHSTPYHFQAAEPSVQSPHLASLSMRLGQTLLTFGGLLAAVSAAFALLTKRNLVLAATTGESAEGSGVSRRDALWGIAVAGGAAAGIAPPPAHAGFLGFGDDPNAIYKEDTQKMLNEIKAVLVLDNSDPTKQEQIAALRRDMNGWVSKYRRDTRFSGRASYGNLYSVINAVAGQYTNFGTKTPIPKKRAAQIVVEINNAENLIAKGR